VNRRSLTLRQRPDLAAVEAQITHTTRKINNATKTMEEVDRNETKLSERVQSLQNELASVKKAADAAQGTYRLFRIVSR